MASQLRTVSSTEPYTGLYGLFSLYTIVEDWPSTTLANRLFVRSAGQRGLSSAIISGLITLVDAPTCDY